MREFNTTCRLCGTHEEHILELGGCPCVVKILKPLLKLAACRSYKYTDILFAFPDEETQGLKKSIILAWKFAIRHFYQNSIEILKGRRFACRSLHGGAPRHGASAVAASGRVILMRAWRCHVQGPRCELLSATGDSRARSTLVNTAQRSSSAGASACPLATQRNPSKRVH
jgi:hypothetical protein